MQLLALDAALGPCSVALLDGETCLAGQWEGGKQNLTALPAMAQAVLGHADIDAVCVCVGPGSFTGLRAALALAHGIALARAVPVVGVTAAEAFAEGVALPPGAVLWVALDTRRGRIFLARDGAVQVVEPSRVPRPGGLVVAAGDAAPLVVAQLQAMGCPVALGETAIDLGRLASAAMRRLSGQLPPCPAQPLYVEPPEARRAKGLRPAPT